MFKKNLLFIFSILFLISSCQQEEEVVLANEDTGINLTRHLSNLIGNTAANDGSIDNIVDNASCIEFEVPFTVVVNGIGLVVEDHNDLQIIEAIFEASQTDENILNIVYPITIIFSDFSELIIQSDEELLNHTSTCDGENIVDEDIECLDFVYPLSFTLFDAQAVVLDTITISTDEALFSFITTLSSETIVSLDFPIQVVLANGDIENIAQQNELEFALENAQDSCDEDDDNDHDDDDNIDTSQEELIVILTNCPWEIDTLFVDNTSAGGQFENTYLDFNENFTVTAFSNNSTETGIWSLDPEGNSFRLNIELNGIPEFSTNWLLHTVEDNDDLILEFRNALEILRIEENCDIEDVDAGGVLPFNEVIAILQTCDWVLNINGNIDFLLYNFTFEPNGVLKVVDLTNAEVFNGEWLLEQETNGAFFLTIANLPAAFEELNMRWEIFHIQNDFIELENEDQTSWLFMDLTCPNDIDLETLLRYNSWKISLLVIEGEDQTSIFSQYELAFEDNNYLIAFENGVSDIIGSYELLNNDTQILIDFEGVEPLNLLESPNWTVIDIQENKVELAYTLQGDVYILVIEAN